MPYWRHVNISRKEDKYVVVRCLIRHKENVLAAMVGGHSVLLHSDRSRSSAASRATGVIIPSLQQSYSRGFPISFPPWTIHHTASLVTAPATRFLIRTDQ